MDNQAQWTPGGDPANWIMAGITTLMFVLNLYQVHRFSQTSLANTTLTFLGEYSDKEMRGALAELRRFKHEQPQLIVDMNRLFIHTAQMCEVDEACCKAARQYMSEFEEVFGEARSMVAWFFSKAWRLQQSGFLDGRTLKMLLRLDGARTFIDIACPMTLAYRFVRIHNENLKAFLTDPNVLWYKETRKVITSQKER